MSQFSTVSSVQINTPEQDVTYNMSISTIKNNNDNDNGTADESNGNNNNDDNTV